MAAFQQPSSPVEFSPWVNHQGSLPPEVDIEGNIEYKLKLIATAPDRFEHLVTQLKWRLSEGHGSAIYEIGVADDGSFVGLSPQDMEVSLQTLHRMADFLKADVTVLRRVSVESTQQVDTLSTEDGSCTPGVVRRRLSTNLGSPRTDPEYLVVEARVTSRLAEEHHFLEIRVALIGGPDAGKSTLLGRLAHGIADNGRGKARLNLLRHRHEISTGRTSSISHEIIGFTATGETVNYNTTNISSWQEVCESSAKVVTLLDTCGHPRFLKTTISGLTGHAPDYACLVVDSRVGGVNEMTREHLALSVALGLPTFVVVTKMDVATRDQLRATVTALMGLIRTTGPTVNGEIGVTIGPDGETIQPKAIPVIVHNEKDLETIVKRFSDDGAINETKSVAIPILLLSSVTGENVNLLEKFLFLLPKPSLDTQGTADSQEPACYQIEEIYSIPDIGTVVGGFLHTGRIEIHGVARAPKETIHSSTLVETSGESQQTSSARTSNSMRLYLGPVDRDGSFIPVVVKSIHRQRMSMRSIESGQTATLAIEGPGLSRIKVRRGMVVLESDTDPRGTCCQTFEAVIQVLAHDGLFGIGFQGMIHCGSVHQNARVMGIELLQTPGQEDEAISALDGTEDLGPTAEPLRPTSRASIAESIHSGRSSSPSSDYGSGTGSSVPGSVAVSRSSSFRRDNPLVDRLGDDHNDFRPRAKRNRQQSNQHGMIPISTVRTFRRLSVQPPSVGPSLCQQPQDSNDDINTSTTDNVTLQDQDNPVELEIGSRARVVFQFCHDVVFMREGTTVLFRHEGTKCVGKVLRML
ncbi:GTP binding protein [Linnemannia exigua]|uniref:GTP binding protein n=1 Tax=Linnemannia exigua TaxID=604196 RepID=A0AAD4DBH8_9FUNG|nr:GTP binding protein [Linnemannia exigua]